LPTVTNRAFREFEELETPVEQDWAGHAWHLYVLRLHLDRLRISRDEFVTELCRRNIGTSVHFIPVHLFTYYRDRYRYSPEDFPVAFGEFQRILSLPCSPRMSDNDVEDVIDAVRSVLQEKAFGGRVAGPIAVFGSNRVRDQVRRWWTCLLFPAKSRTGIPAVSLSQVSHHEARRRSGWAVDDALGPASHAMWALA